MKKKKGLNKWWFVLIGVIVVAGFLVFMPKPSAGMMYDKETAQTGEIKTYYQFSGMIDAVSKQSVMLNMVSEIKSLEVSEGDIVKSDDVLFTTTQGTSVDAAINGEVTSVNISEGDVVGAGAPILNIVNFDELKVDIKVDEYTISNVSVNDEVEVYVEALGKTVTGVITRVSKEAINQNGVSYFSATVELAADEELRVGLTSEIKLSGPSVENAVVVSVGVLNYDEDNNPYVLMYDEKGDIVKQAVTTGLSDGVKVQIIEGLTATDEVLKEKEVMMPPGAPEFK